MNEAETSPNPPAVPKCVPGIAQSIGLCSLFYGLVAALTLGLYCLKRFAGVSFDMFQRLLVVQVIAWPLILWAGLGWSKIPFRVACPLTRFPVRIVPALLVACFGSTILLLALASLIPMPEALRKVMAESITGSSKPTLFFSAAVAAPILEELFFRGWVLRGYLGRYSVTKAVWASAVLFAVFHLNPWQAAGALPLGLGFAWLFLRTGSLVPGILCHATFNFSTTFLLSPLELALGYDTATQKAMRHVPPSMLAIGGVMAALGGFILWRQLAKLPNEPRA